jgi:hypothetical protein
MGGRSKIIKSLSFFFFFDNNRHGLIGLYPKILPSNFVNCRYLFSKRTVFTNKILFFKNLILKKNILKKKKKKGGRTTPMAQGVPATPYGVVRPPLFFFFFFFFSFFIDLKGWPRGGSTPRFGGKSMKF